MKATDFENKQFNRGIRGYDAQEVDQFINELLNYCQRLENKNKTLETKVAEYDQQERFIQSALVIAEQTAETIKNEAELKAKNVQSQAKMEAQSIMNEAKKEAEAYRDTIHKCFYGYERDLRFVIDHFYSQARKHMQDLEKDLAGDIQNVISRFDQEYNSFPHLDDQKTVSENSSSKVDPSATQFEEKEPALLLGQILQHDIINAAGHVVAKKDTVVTHGLITSLIEKDLYGDLIASIDKNEG